MEFASIEVDAAQNFEINPVEMQVRELVELELALVGGGNGDIHLA